ncbi:hypothetical protein DTQ13_06120 [Parasaccharibacter sp. TMW 2.1888]|uniref:hypothetical protein n=1 Tax=unclassified Parasaccharibacter TaxID=2626400 RepID=UPI00200F13DE|nr:MULTISPECIES: hypothetical protein [unclassified Parasaccharibacter]MCK8636200.1 hypothetical protein [Parasaccharibacter sp. TMW2.1885]UPO79914.1 hypothetical protein DTQ13_06120 [Parasaccharibacter sp. TMW 2.1888]
MKHFLLLTVAFIGLSGVAWADNGLTLAQQNERQMEANRKAAMASCGPRGCVQSEIVPSQSDWDAVSNRMAAETEIHLRQMGMSPNTARKAVWATQHKPYSACSHYVAQLTADYENGLDRPDYDDKLIASVERSGTCERKNLD